jgi:hypothetical protein
MKIEPKLDFGGGKILFCQDYFNNVEVPIRVWSHCRASF